MVVGHSPGAFDRPGALSLMLVEKGTPGFTQTKLKKQGWWCSDTAALCVMKSTPHLALVAGRFTPWIACMARYFDDVRVPASNLIGEEGKGFKGIMHNFNQEVCMCVYICVCVCACGCVAVCAANHNCPTSSAVRPTLPLTCMC